MEKMLKIGRDTSDWRNKQFRKKRSKPSKFIPIYIYLEYPLNIHGSLGVVLLLPLRDIYFLSGCRCYSAFFSTHYTLAPLRTKSPPAVGWLAFGSHSPQAYDYLRLIFT